MNKKARFIAFYLAQFHPIPENNEWWGPGFTEWTNVTKAKPLFSGHNQPRLPADLGFYDLRLAEVREAQAKLAKENGVEGFCYYHYWFGEGKMVLERPINEVLASGKPDLPFCFCWANESWEGRWHGVSNKKRALITQTYPGKEDYIKHFDYLEKAFKDPRYIKVNGMPTFQVYCPHLIPDIKEFVTIFREEAIKRGLPGIHLVGGQKTPTDWNPTEHGFDAKISGSFAFAFGRSLKPVDTIVDFLWNNKVAKKLYTMSKDYHRVTRYDYRKFIANMKRIHQEDKALNHTTYPIVVNDFDNTARAGKKGVAFMNTSPELYMQHIEEAYETIKDRKDDEKIIFIKSWNEWAEGNYLEPDSKVGKAYLEVIKKFNTKG